MRHFIGLAVIASIAAPASAQHMNAEVFHQRATKLEKKGPAALFSMGEIKTLMREAEGAGKAVRAQRVAAEVAGKKGAYCPPPGKTSMDNKEFMTRLSAIPQADRRRMDMTGAMNRILAAKYPCPR